MLPIKIQLAEESNLVIHWRDGHRSTTSLRTLRDNCPCAGCQGETVLLRTFKPAPQPEMPGKYVLQGAAQIGSYALKITWGDGHSTGIYTWERLRSLCECSECNAARGREG